MRRILARNRAALGLISCLLLAGESSGNSATATATEAPRLSPATTNQIEHLRARPAVVRITPRLAEIVRMVKARLELDLIRVYIKSSTTPFNPTAADIVVLKQIEIPPELITAMLERDAELRSRSSMASGAQLSRPGTLGSPGPIAYPRSAVPYPPGYATGPNYPYPTVPYSRPAPVFLGPLTSFNNSYPTFINGQAIYSGYYLPSVAF